MRDRSIDILRFIGLSCIILVHCNCPFVLSQLRCFDVPLMLFVSGLSFSGKTINNYFDFIVKRAKRLLIPTWSFVSAFMLMMLCAQYVFQKPLYSLSYIVESFAMTGGIGYVWIIRVFLLIAIITPIISLLERKISKDNTLIISILALGGVVELITIYNFSLEEGSLLYRFLSEWVITIISYSLFFYLGLRMRKVDTKRQRRFLLVFTLVLIVSLMVYYHNYGLPIKFSPCFKYPPHSYYILYGLFACSLLWSVRNFLTSIFGHKIFAFIGKNTIWIYLYHILLLNIPLPANWMLKYIIVYGGALLLFGVQFAIYKRLKNRFTVAKYLIG